MNGVSTTVIKLVQVFEIVRRAIPAGSWVVHQARLNQVGDASLFVCQLRPLGVNAIEVTRCLGMENHLRSK